MRDKHIARAVSHKRSAAVEFGTLQSVDFPAG